MNCFQLIKTVLDEAFQQIDAKNDNERFVQIEAELASLSKSYATVIHGHKIDYTKPVSEALGCRQNYPVLILRLQPDGSFRWPEGDVLSVKETLAMIPVWCDANEDGVVAVLAPRDAKLSHAVPVLNAAKESGHFRVVLATDGIVR